MKKVGSTFKLQNIPGVMPSVEECSSIVRMAEIPIRGDKDGDRFIRLNVYK